MTKHQKLIREVLDRDGEMCADCGQWATEVHHIISRRFKGAWDVRNMITLCHWCHQLKNKGAGADTHAKRIEHIRWLAERYGYDYSDMGEKWQELVREGLLERILTRYSDAWQQLAGL